MSLVSELRRRNVLRMAVLYAVAAWLIMQVAEVVMTLASLPDWTGRAALTLLAIGFPIALIFSWFYELTPEGISLEKDVDPADSVTHMTGRRIDFVVISLLSAAIILFAWHTWWPSVPMDNSVAVLAFENMSDDPEQEYFSDGISEELLNMLAQIDGLRVISRSSSFSFKGKDVDLPTVARKLNVAHVLEGSVRKMGNRVRITAQLINANTDSHIWSETYDHELTARNVFAIQSQIAKEIINALTSVLSQEDRNRLSRVPTQNLQAYEAYLLGKQRMLLRTRMALMEASEYFEKAVKLDPQYALAYVGLADANLLLGNYAYVPLNEALAKAEPALSAALSLDDQLGAAYASMGLSRQLQGDSVGAENAFKHSIALNPNYATSYHWYGDVLMISFGQPEAAIPLLEKARELDPLSPVIIVTLGQALGGIGKIPEAMMHYRKAVEIQPDYPSAHNLMGMAYLALGDDAKAEYWIDRGLSLYPEDFLINGAKAFLHRYRDEEVQALQVARHLLSIAPGNNVSLLTLVNYGQYQEALDTIAPDYPELTCEDEPTVTPNNLFRAMNLSLALQETGERLCANRLLDKILEQLQTGPGQGYRAYGFLDAEVFARQGKTQRALEALREAINKGSRISWWTQVEGSPHMASLLDHPELKAMMAEIRTDMAAQLANIREMEARGELAPIAK